MWSVQLLRMQAAGGRSVCCSMEEAFQRVNKVCVASNRKLSGARK